MGQELAGTTVAAGSAWHDFGYMTVEPQGNGWHVVLRAVDGSEVRTCRLLGRRLTCEP
jgi:hypothetical protein